MWTWLRKSLGKTTTSETSTKSELLSRLAHLETPAPGHVVTTFQLEVSRFAQLQSLADELDVAFLKKEIPRAKREKASVITLVGKRENVQQVIQQVYSTGFSGPRLASCSLEP